MDSSPKGFSTPTGNDRRPYLQEVNTPQTVSSDEDAVDEKLAGYLYKLKSGLVRNSLLAKFQSAWNKRYFAFHEDYIVYFSKESSQRPRKM